VGQPLIKVASFSYGVRQAFRGGKTGDAHGNTHAGGQYGSAQGGSYSAGGEN
jgi:secreted protein